MSKHAPSTTPSPISPVDVFRQGMNFHVAYKVLMTNVYQWIHAIEYPHQEFISSKNSGRVPTVIPMMVCGSFTIEMYLKTLSLLDSGKFERSHDFVILFNALSQNTKDNVRDAYASAQKYYHPDFVEHLKQQKK